MIGAAGTPDKVDLEMPRCQCCNALMLRGEDGYCETCEESGCRYELACLKEVQ